MHVNLTCGVILILDQQDQAIGTGFILTNDGLIATCAHVVESVGGGPAATVQVIIYATNEKRETHVIPEWWRDPCAEDVAILQLIGNLPDSAKPLPLGSSISVSNHLFETIGFPSTNSAGGILGSGHILGKTVINNLPVLQLRSQEITGGFSGAPVWDCATHRVVGMVTATADPDGRWRLAETAFITPTETLRRVCTNLQLTDICPYRGLAAFTETDTEFFFGREALVANLIAQLGQNPRFLAVIGSSGSGKSSVVQAGLFPALHRGEVPGSQSWHILSFRPGNDPFVALATAGLKLDEEVNLSTAVQDFLDHHSNIHRLVLYADQFEELFALCPEPIQIQFIRELVGLLNSNIPVTVILTLRADFYGHLLRHSELGEQLNIGQVNILPMRPAELNAAIEKPAERAGLHFESGLVEIIATEARQVEHPLPLLEAALTRLWEQQTDGWLTHNAYQQVGQVIGAIGQWANDTYNALGPTEKRLTHRIFTRLVYYSEGGTTDTRQRLPLEALVTHPEEKGSVHRLVQRLADSRLLVTDRDEQTGQETIEIIHDALLREWGQLCSWLKEQREFYLWRQRLNERLREWHDKKGELLRGASLVEAEHWLADRPEDLIENEKTYIQDSLELRDQEQMAGRRIRQRFIIGISTAILSFIVMLAGFAWIQRNQAITQSNLASTAIAAESIANTRREEALARQLAAQAQIIPQNTGDGLTRGVLLAVESVRRLESFEGDQAIRQGLGLLPKMVSRMKHTRGTAKTLAFSSDGKLLISGDWEGIAQVWEVNTGVKVAHTEHERPLSLVNFSPEGYAVSAEGDPGRDHYSAVVRIWDPILGKTVAELQHPNKLRTIVFSNDGRWLASGTDYGTVYLWNLKTLQEEIRMDHKWGIGTLAFSPDNRLLAIGTGDVNNITSGGEVHVWDMVTGQEIFQSEHSWVVNTVIFSKDGRLLASASHDRTVKIWDVSSWQQVAQLEHDGAVFDVDFSPDGRRVASGTSEEAVSIWDVATQKEFVRMKHEGYVYDVSFSFDGRWVVSGSEDGTARVWDAVTGQEISRAVHPDTVWVATFSPDGHLVGSQSVDGTVQVWEAQASQEIARITYANGVEDIAFSSDGRFLATAGHDNTARVWRLFPLEEIAQMKHEKSVEAVVFSSDGRLLITGSEDNTARVWEASTGQELMRVEHKDGILDVAISPNDQWVATGGRDATVRIWSLSTGKELANLKNETAVAAVNFDSSGQRIAAGSWSNGGIQVWEILSGDKVFHFEAVAGGNDVAFSADGQWIASGEGSREGGFLRIWDANTGAEITQVKLENSVWSLAFSSDSHFIAAGTERGMMGIWNMTTKKQVGAMKHEDVISSIAFSSDNRLVASGSWDNTVRIWLFQSEDLILEACSRLLRNLTKEEWGQYIPDEPYRKTCDNLAEPGN